MAVWHEYPTPEEAGRGLADAVALRLSAAVARNGHACLAVPGGTTPRHFLAALSGHDLPWDRITIMPTDERFVGPDDAQSNERMIRANMPVLASGQARWVSFHGAGETLEAAAAALDERLAGLPALDVLVCGMGADAHIASLFPGEPALDISAALHVVPARPPGLPPRLSLAPKRLVDAQDVFLLVGGGAKKDALAEARGRAPSQAPVSLLLARSGPVDIYWSATT